MDDGLAFDAVTAFLLDDRGAVTRLVSLDHGFLPDPGTVVIVMAFADG